MVWNEVAAAVRRGLAPVILGLAALLPAMLIAGGCGGDDGPSDASVQGDGGSGDSDAAVDEGAGASGGAEDGGAGGDGGSLAGSGASGSGAGNSGSGSGDGGSGELPPPLAIPSDCPEPAINQPPEELRCTGLYTDVDTKELAGGIEPFVPAYELWSDGAEKDRWVYLPPGAQIDSSDPDDWRFPLGTKLFKEFRWNGRRVETRMFWKATSTLWIKAAYRWNEAETEATRFGGGDIDVDGDTYHIPTGSECDQCHKGRIDRSLGFELASLGLPGASGMTLARLIDEDRLSDPPEQAELELGDDGTGKAAAALGWLHVNCGVSCHNDNTTAEAYKTDMYLRLPAAGLDGRSPVDFDLIATTVGIDARTPRWNEETRIVAGSPEDSLLYQLISTRDADSPKDQMPPIASRVVHDEGVMLVGDWIRSLQP